jgi:hypothetical protein
LNRRWNDLWMNWLSKRSRQWKMYSFRNEEIFRLVDATMKNRRPGDSCQTKHWLIWVWYEELNVECEILGCHHHLKARWDLSMFVSFADSVRVDPQ